MALCMDRKNLTEEDVEILESLSGINVKLPSVDISGYVDITSPAPDGVEVVKKALKQARRIKDKKRHSRHHLYRSAPLSYSTVTAPDYKVLSLSLRIRQAVMQIHELHGRRGTPF